MAIDFNLKNVTSNLQSAITKTNLELLDIISNDIEPYVPYRTGELSDSKRIDEQNLQVVWDDPKAQYVYNLPTSANFTRTTNNKATSYWVEEAQSSLTTKWVEDYEQLLKRNMR